MFRFLISIALSATILASCGGSNTDKKSDAPLSGEQVYMQNCITCHGVDGKAQMAGATDLSVSTLTAEQSAAVITNGRNGMRSFSNELSKDEIDAVVKHIQTLRK
jgi:mono/diheme cytochrome c family protein